MDARQQYDCLFFFSKRFLPLRKDSVSKGKGQTDKT
jgi:hypothetical protein